MQIAILAFALMSLFTATLARPNDSDLAKCKDNTLKCGGGNPGGAVFICRKGRWEVLIDCGASESCVTDPIPTCTWAKTSIVDAVSAITGFENSDDLVAADVKEKADTAASTPSTDSKADDTTKVGTSADGPYYNICSPCIRHNDNCKAIECDWQGKQCDRHCNQKTCSVNLTTGDWRQPTVSCGHFCKWPCY